MNQPRGGRLPDFVIIGAARSGTTSLARYLSAHPQVHVAPLKELNFFDHDDRYANGVEWYVRQLGGAKEGQVVGEATPSYMTVARSAARMAEVVPQAKLIAILRNPVDRAFSLYWWTRLWPAEEREPEEALREAMRHEGPSDEPPRAYLGSYVEQLRRFCTYYPRDSLQVHLFEDLTERPRETFAAICRFIGVDDTVVPAEVGRRFNEPHQVRHKRVRGLARRVRRYSPRVGRRLAMMASTRFEIPPQDPTLRAELVEYFRPHNEALARWLGRDLSAWDR